MAEHVYEPWGTCLALFEDRSPELVLSGPAGTGKSRACLEKLLAIVLKYPGARGLIVRKTLTSLGTTALVTWRKYVIPELMESGAVRFYGGSKEQAAQYRFSNGSSVMVCGMDRATRIMSSEYDVIYVQECTELTVTDLENLTTRLRNGVVPYQQLIADCNPDTPTHWLKKRCDDGQSKMLHCLHTDNPTLYTRDGVPTKNGEAYIAKLDNLTGVRKQRLKYGQWVAAEGMIYQDEWSEPDIMCDPLRPPAEYPRIWSVDFGFVHPFVLQQWAITPDGDMVLYREIYETRRTVDQHAERIMSIVAPNGMWIEPRPTAILCDHDAENRAQLERGLGMSTLAANKRVTEGIQAVQKRMRDRRLRIARNCVVKVDTDLREAGKPTCTAEEIPGYVWDTGAGKQVREAPLKIMDDGCDAMRYAVAFNDLRSSPSVRRF